jgi:hypothetical protein
VVDKREETLDSLIFPVLKGVLRAQGVAQGVGPEFKLPPLRGGGWCGNDVVSRPPLAHTCNPILATQEAEIRRFSVGSQPRQIVCQTLS